MGGAKGFVSSKIYKVNYKISSNNTVVSCISGLPDFLIRMRQASKDYQKYKLSIVRSDGSHLTLTEENTSKEQVKNDVEDKLKEDEGSMSDSKDQQDDPVKNLGDLDLIRDAQKESETKDIPTTANSAPKEEKGLLHYFYLTKLIALLDI